MADRRRNSLQRVPELAGTEKLHLLLVEMLLPEEQLQPVEPDHE